MELNYERLTAAIACGIRNGLRLAREEQQKEARKAIDKEISFYEKLRNRYGPRKY